MMTSGPKPTHRDTARAGRYGVRVFVDFWNYTLSMREVDPAFRTDWSKLGPALSRATATVVGSERTPEHQGLNFYGSYDPSSDQDRKLHRWATKVVASFPGNRVVMSPRPRKLSPPGCPACREPLANCPACGADMRGTEEKGVDVRMATDMISLAWSDNYDVAVLVSSDRDFIPVAEFLGDRGLKVIHGAIPPKGAHLSTASWGSIDLGGHKTKVEALLEGVARDAAEALREALGVAVRAARTDLGASEHRVPGGVGPLDRALV